MAGSTLHLFAHLLKDDRVGLLNRRIERSAVGSRFDDRKRLHRPIVFDQLPREAAIVCESCYLGLVRFEIDMYLPHCQDAAMAVTKRSRGDRVQRFGSASS